MPVPDDVEQIHVATPEVSSVCSRERRSTDCSAAMIVDCCTAKNMPNERARSDHAAGDQHGLAAHICLCGCQAATAAGSRPQPALID
jgi:hypothetical protein